MAVAATLLLLTACAPAVTGVAAPGSGQCASPVPDTSSQPPSTPTVAPVITVDDRNGYWIRNAHPAPLGLTVYPDGTVIRAEGDGSHSEPLPSMVIGRIDPCQVRRAIDMLSGLGGADFGEPQVTDQGTTTVTVIDEGSGTTVLSAYALGIGDEYVDDAQSAARSTLAAAIGTIGEALSAERPWAPDRLRFTRFDGDVPGPTLVWPLAGSISDALPGRTVGDFPCGVVTGVDADAVADALSGGPALSAWNDGRSTAALAIGVLVPGQAACAG